uniref:Uncharacterized protein n=1 Tax=Anguilla anguilla TaxID=7936 RepID=A0A0E9RHA7_ANGAN
MSFPCTLTVCNDNNRLLSTRGLL